MTTFFDDLNNRFREMHSDILKAMEGLPIAALDWVPGAEINSLAVLVTHLTGAERYWIGLAVNETLERDREAEFRAKGLNGLELKAFVVSADEYNLDALARLSLPDLEVVRHSPRNDKSFTVGWCLMHALEHTCQHTGHITLTRQLWDLRKPGF
jgi:uncharacterized damage-inducible protein DinB